MSEKKVKYDIQYAKDKLKRIPLDVKKEYYDTIKEHAETQGETVNGFIKRAISETMESDKGFSVKFPCRVGDPLYIIEPKCRADQEPEDFDCDSVNCDECEYDKELVVVERKASLYLLCELVAGHDNSLIMGETVFLTMEKAEKALEDMKEK